MCLITVPNVSCVATSSLILHHVIIVFWMIAEFREGEVNLRYPVLNNSVETTIGDYESCSGEVYRYVQVLCSV